MSKVGKFLYLTQDIPRDTKPPYRTAKLWVSSSLSNVCYFEHKKEPDKQLRKKPMWPHVEERLRCATKLFT